VAQQNTRLQPGQRRILDALVVSSGRV